MTARRLLRAVLLLVTLAVPAAGQEEAGRGGAGREPGDRSLPVSVLPRAVRIVDRPLLDADGRGHRFLRDLVGRGPALVSFTFTGCQALCPVSDLVMDAVAERLGRANPTGVRLLTLTLDPLNDTPAKLRQERADALHPDRLFLTGAPDDVWAVLDGLGIAGGVAQNHDVDFLLIGQGGAAVRAVAGMIDADTLAAEAAAIR